MQTTEISERPFFSVIYQDHHLLIVNKSAGVVIHPTYKYADGTMWDALLAYSQQIDADDWQPVEFADEEGWSRAPEAVRMMLRKKKKERLWQEEGVLPRPCLLHRLDKDTSGIVALARTARARRHLIKQFEERTIEKRYIALVSRGAPAWTQPQAPLTLERLELDGTRQRLQLSNAEHIFVRASEDVYFLDGALQRDPADRRRCIVGPEGQSATTSFKVLATESAYALLEVRPITGRTHQIRAHLAALGFAIVGDPLYGFSTTADTTALLLQRQFLHAYSLTFYDYPANQRVTLSAPLAPELRSWLKQNCSTLFDYAVLHL